MPLPDFEPPSYYELCDLWPEYRGNPQVRRLILEINHNRRVLDRIRAMRETINKRWYEETGTKLVALEELRSLLLEEEWREGRMGKSM